MKWNWKKKGWPEFRFDAGVLVALEAEFLTSSGVLLGTCRHLPEEELSELRIELMSDEALKTSEIEGEFLNRESLQSSIRRQFGGLFWVNPATISSHYLYPFQPKALLGNFSTSIPYPYQPKPPFGTIFN